MSDKKLCGLWGAHVDVSKFNDNGLCGCLNCNGTHCQQCSVFEQYAAQSVQHGERAKCFLCQTFITKNR